VRESRFTEEQIVGVLREVEAGRPVAEPCCKHGISEQTPYRWKAMYGGFDVSDATRTARRRSRTSNDGVDGGVTMAVENLRRTRPPIGVAGR